MATTQTTKMMTVMGTVVLVASVTGLVGCSNKTAPVSTNVAPKLEPVAEAAQPAVPEGQHGSRRMKNLDVPVLVDGEQVAVLRHGELPTSIKAHDDKANGTEEARYFRFTEYFTAIGVDVKSIKAIHFQANHERVASIEGQDFRAQPARFVFDFLGGDEGMVKAAWDTTGLKNVFHSSEMYAVSVFVKKAPPAVNTDKGCYFVDGKCSNALAYVDGKVPTGTRFYQDGKLLGMAKRRTLADNIVIGRDGEDYKYSVAKFVSTLGADADGAKSIDLLQGDDVVARFSADEWKNDSSALFFKLPKHNHGKIRVYVPASVQATSDSPANREATISAVIIHKSSPVTKSDLSPISDEALTQAVSDQGETKTHGDEG